ncbi:MAG: type II secretion system F family protein [Burkholderiales bacterium]|jgi:type IV pilus assembly protein PilC|nr:type II secretion system F family protein [Burkholderiales bacterium]
MATAATRRQETKSSSTRRQAHEALFVWKGVDKGGRSVRGEMRGASSSSVTAALRRQGVKVQKIRKKSFSGGRSIKSKDISFFTRQLATMMKAGVPLLQTFDIIGRGHENPRFSRLLFDIKGKIESGSSMAQAFRAHPLYFNDLYCNLVAAGEAAGILDNVLDRLATYQEKTIALKGKIKSALTYPIAVLVITAAVIGVIMYKVIPAFVKMFNDMNASLPLPTQFVVALSNLVVNHGLLFLISIIASVVGIVAIHKRSASFRMLVDRTLLRLPVFGPLIEKSTLARWTRTLSTMFSAGVPLVEALDSVGGSSGNGVYAEATKKIKIEVSTGASLTNAMTNSQLFPSMVLQMTQIGEESGALDEMLTKIADFYEREVDDAVESLSSLLQPMIIVILGVVIGGIVISIYLPIFQLGNVVG